MASRGRRQHIARRAARPRTAQSQVLNLEDVRSQLFECIDHLSFGEQGVLLGITTSYWQIPITNLSPPKLDIASHGPATEMTMADHNWLGLEDGPDDGRCRL